MSRNLLKSALVSTGIALSFIVQSNQTVKAAIVNYDVSVFIDFGPLMNNTYSGTLSYDYAVPPLTGVGTETTPLSTFNFFFDGHTYTQADDPTSDASFYNGNFIGIDYAISSPPSPTFLSGTVAIDPKGFSYDQGGFGGAGTGMISYTLVTTTVPEPLNILGSITVFGLGASLKRRLN